MKHLKSTCKLNRNSSHRKAMFRNLINSLISYEKIKTTIQKAKEIRRIIEPIINTSKINNLSNRRLIFSKIRNKDSTFKLFNEIGPYYKKRNGGYTKIIKCGFRTGDKALMSYIMLTERNKIKNHNITKKHKSSIVR